MHFSIGILPRTCSRGEPSFNSPLIITSQISSHFHTPSSKDRSPQMHTIIFRTIASLLLPLLVTAHGPWYPPVWPPVNQPYYSGDVLNITKCYCEGPTEDSGFGHYYQFDYWNFHNAQAYTLAWTCDSDVSVTGRATIDSTQLPFPVPECWNDHDSWRKEKRKECSKSYNGDTFCFELGASSDPYDYYYFNKQKRGLPEFGIIEFSPDQCVALCRDKVGGKTVARYVCFPSKDFVFDIILPV